jgi:hypothetical protein
LIGWNLERLEIVTQEATGPASGRLGKNDGFQGFLEAYCRELVHLRFSFSWPEDSGRNGIVPRMDYPFQGQVKFQL